MSHCHALNVLLTVDVEIWPTGWNLDQGQFKKDFRKYIYGPTPHGQYALPVQLDLLNKFGVKGIFLVESLFACEFGIEPLKEIVNLVQSAGHEVQLHLHPEWVSHLSEPLLGNRHARKLRDYSEGDQTTLIKQGLQNLKMAGATKVNAFRAGGYAGNVATLKALAANGISFDTSYNPCILGSGFDIRTNGPLLQPTRIHNVLEVPVSCFCDWPGHFRHAQLGACSFAELSEMLVNAWQSGWDYFVIVSHGFELLTPSKTKRDPIISRRFTRLLEFLSKHADKFKTPGFNDLSPDNMMTDKAVTMLRSTPHRTALRYAEQATRRLFR
jgi:hypothetical protein